MRVPCKASLDDSTDGAEEDVAALLRGQEVVGIAPAERQIDLQLGDVTESQAIELIDARAAKGPAKKKGRGGAKKKAPARKKAAKA